MHGAIMWDSKSNISSFERLYIQLSNQLFSLAEYILNVQSLQAYYYHIKTAGDNHEVTPIVFKNKKARGWISAALMETTTREKSTGRTAIFPGILVLKMSDHPKCIQLISDVNLTKEQIQSLTANVDKSQLRTILDNHNPLCSLVMLTRKVHSIVCEKDSTISASWNMRSGMRVLSEKNFQTRVTSAKQANIITAECAAKYKKIFEDKKEICQFKVKRNVIPTTVYNIWSIEDSKKKLQISGQTPLLIFSDSKINVKHLQSISEPKQRAKRLDATPEKDLLIPELNIYMSKINKK